MDRTPSGNARPGTALACLSPAADLLAPSVAALAAGITWARTFDGAGPRLFVAIVVPLLALVTLTAYRCNRPASSRLLLLPFYFLLGGFLAAPSLQPPADPDHLLHHMKDGEEVVLAGILTEHPATDPDLEKSRLLMKVEEVRRLQRHTRASGLIRLTMPGPVPAGLAPGDRFLARAVISTGDSYDNPGSFDYRSYLNSQGIWLTGWIRSPTHVVELHRLEPPPLLERLRYAPERFRQQLGTFLGAVLAQPAAGLYKAVLLGDRSGVANPVLEQFKASGTMHLLAISGLHMGLLALLAGLLFNGLLRRSTWALLHLPVRKSAAALTLVPLFGYALLAGFQVPVVRALLMIGVFLLAVLFDRQRALATTIGLAALLMLLYRPASLFTVSFQLSFAAVIGMAVAYQRLTARLVPDASSFAIWHPRRWTGWAFAGVAASLAALLGTLPLLLFYFNRVSLLSPLATLLVEPLLCLWALLFGLPACFLQPVWPWLAAQLLQLGSLGIEAAALLIGWLATLPGSSLWLSTPTLLEIGAYYLLLAGVLHRRRLSGKVVIVICLFILAAVPLWSKHHREDEITFLDVGQGSATVLELAGRTLLIDGGGHQSESFNTGERLIAPFLWKKRINRLEAVVISHPHADHYNGLAFVIRRFRPRTVWINGPPERQQTDPGYQALLDLAREQGAVVRAPDAGTELFRRENIVLSSLAAPAARGSTNNRSLLLRLECRGSSFLFPGDMDPELVRMTLVPDERQTDVLLAPHHGHQLTAGTRLLADLSPHYLVVSGGRRQWNRYMGRIPAEAWQAAGITVLATSRQGALSLAPEAGNLRIRAGRERQELSLSIP